MVSATIKKIDTIVVPWQLSKLIKFIYRNIENFHTHQKIYNSRKKKFVCVCEGKTRESLWEYSNGLTLQSPNLFHYLTEMYVEAYLCQIMK
jgi:hypothetical protein